MKINCREYGLISLMSCRKSFASIVITLNAGSKKQEEDCAGKKSITWTLWKVRWLESETTLCIGAGRIYVWPLLVQRQPEVMCLRTLGNMLESAVLDDETTKSVGGGIVNFRHSLLMVRSHLCQSGNHVRGSGILNLLVISPLAFTF